MHDCEKYGVKYDVPAITCFDCGGDVVLSGGRERTREYEKGVTLPIPDDFPILTCGGCGEEYSSLATHGPLDAYLKAHFYDPQVRAQEKQASRVEDERRLASGEITREQLRKENSRITPHGAVMRLDLCKRLA